MPTIRSKHLSLVLCCCISTIITAQSSSSSATTAQVLGPPAVPLSEQLYTTLLQEQGANARYRAAEQALNHCEAPKVEFCAKLYNLLAEEAYLEQDYPLSKYYYHQVLETPFENDYYQEGLLATRMRLNALVGLRNIAINETKYDTALVWQDAYVDSLEDYMGREMQRYQQDIDYTYARCYQQLGESEKAIEHLVAHAFGSPSGALEFSLNKAMVDALTNLLYTKYPKKVYKRKLQYIATAIYTEEKEGRLRFYVKIFENKIYFRNDSANYSYRVTKNPQLRGQAIAHYQRKLLNSYFYQSLMKQY
ncbi:MAG: hypothetical protein AB8E82_20050 [Aureispira sp.]